MENSYRFDLIRDPIHLILNIFVNNDVLHVYSCVSVYNWTFITKLLFRSYSVRTGIIVHICDWRYQNISMKIMVLSSKEIFTSKQI